MNPTESQQISAHRCDERAGTIIVEPETHNAGLDRRICAAPMMITPTKLHSPANQLLTVGERWLVAFMSPRVSVRLRIAGWLSVELD